MVRIRLRRTGMKGQASYRIVAAEKEKPRDGKFLEILGSYNPRTDPGTVVVQEDRIYHWLKNGAQPSDSVVQIFKFSGVTERYERFKAGEELEVLMAESEKMMAERNVNPRTRQN